MADEREPTPRTVRLVLVGRQGIGRIAHEDGLYWPSYMDSALPACTSQAAAEASVLAALMRDHAAWKARDNQP